MKNDTPFSKLVWDIATVSSGDLQTNPSYLGTDFTKNQILDGFNGFVLINFNIYGKAVSSLNPIIRVYRLCPITEEWYKGEALTLSAAITNTTTGEWIATQNFEVSAVKIALALESAETNARLRVVVNRVSKQGV